MKISRFISVLTVTICFVFMAITADNTRKHESILIDNINGLKRQIDALEKKMPNSVYLNGVDDVIALSKENQQLRDQNEYYKSYIKEFSWIKEARDP